MDCVRSIKSVITFYWIWNVKILIYLISSVNSMLSASYLILWGFLPVAELVSLMDRVAAMSVCCVCILGIRLEKVFSFVSWDFFLLSLWRKVSCAENVENPESWILCSSLWIHPAYLQVVLERLLGTELLSSVSGWKTVVEGLFTLFYSQLGRTGNSERTQKIRVLRKVWWSRKMRFFFYLWLCFPWKKIIIRQLTFSALRNLKMEILYSSLITC